MEVIGKDINKIFYLKLFTNQVKTVIIIGSGNQILLTENGGTL